MARAHYIVRVGNAGLATTISPRALNHWHYLYPQHLWGFPRTMTHVNVRAEFEADIANPLVTAYIWFLCNGHGGPGHFVQVGIGQRHLGQGPVRDGNRPIPADIMARLQQGFDHWFEWRPLTSDAALQDQLRQLPTPHPPYQSTLQRVTAKHQSFLLFEALIDGEEHRAAAAIPAALPPAAPAHTLPAIEADLANLRRERTEAHAQGYVYLIHMVAMVEGTSFYKIGMSLDPQIRLQTLQTGNPYPLRIVRTQDVQDMRSAEASLHRQFEAQRVLNLNAREWFDFSGGIGEVEMAFGTL